MPKETIYKIVMLFIFIGISSAQQETDSDRSSVRYINRKPLGMRPEMFAPRIISFPDSKEYGRTFSPNGTEFYDTYGGDPQLIMMSRLNDEGLNRPQHVQFFAGSTSH